MAFEWKKESVVHVVCPNDRCTYEMDIPLGYVSKSLPLSNGNTEHITILSWDCPSCTNSFEDNLTVIESPQGRCVDIQLDSYGENFDKSELMSLAQSSLDEENRG